MRVKKIQLNKFKRFDDLTIDLGENPKKIIALVGPNGCGKSSVFDAFEESLQNFRHYGNEEIQFFSKSFFYSDETLRTSTYNRNESIKITMNPESEVLNRKSFYIRTAYRFTSKINVNTIGAIPNILEIGDEPVSSIALDTRLVANYTRLVSTSYSEFFNGIKTGQQVQQELTGEINRILRNILEIEISDFGNIMDKRGQFYFKKGNVKDFPYANLSSGEKEVIDIVLDLIVKTKEYTNTAFCIDEPELHLNTSIQRKLLIEIEKLIPETCQLWVATHSIGFLRSLQDELKDKSQVLDFSEKDYFSGTHTIVPIQPTRKNWLRIFSTALDDLTGLISPKQIIYCEGKYNPGVNGEERGFDAQVFNNIFSEKYNETIFVSSGGNTELDQRSDIALAILTKVFSELEILVLKDRDVSSGRITTEQDRQLYLNTNPSNHRILKRWEIENYLFDKEILKKYCLENNKEFNEIEYDKLVTDIVNQNVKDEIPKIKNFCGLITSVSNEIFKLNLSKLITEDTVTFAELESCIFQVS